MSTTEQLTRVALSGTYFHPASRHYPDNPSSRVICDRCGMQNILACIGLDSMDLCLHCAQILIEEHERAREQIRITHEDMRLFENLPPVKFIHQHTGFLDTGTDN